MLIEPLIAFFAMLVAWVVIITLTLWKSPAAPGRQHTAARSTRIRSNLDGLI